MDVMALALRRQAVLQQAHNWYEDGDVHCTTLGMVTLSKPLPPGRYCLSGVLTSTDTDGNACLVRLVNAGEQDVVPMSTMQRSSGGNRSKRVFRSTQTAEKLYVYAGINYPQSEGDTASFTNIMIEGEAI